MTGMSTRRCVGREHGSLTAIAQAEIHYEGKGPIGNKQREGLLTKLLKWLF
jgi:hypothetical protein